MMFVGLPASQLQSGMGWALPYRTVIKNNMSIGAPRPVVTLSKAFEFASATIHNGREIRRHIIFSSSV